MQDISLKGHAFSPNKPFYTAIASSMLLQLAFSEFFQLPVQTETVSLESRRCL